MRSVPISKAMLMAAGLGTRLRPFTNFTTKALIPLMGTPIAQFAVDGLISAGVNSIVANVHHDALRSKSGLLNLEYPDAEMKISDESPLLLGSAGGIRHALPYLGTEPFFLSNADVLSDVDWLALARCHHRLRAEKGVSLTLAVFPQHNQIGSYREILFDQESSLITGLGLVATGKPFFIGAAVIHPEALSHIPKDGPAEFVPTILEPAIRAGQAGVFLTSGSWYDLGSPHLWLQTHLSLIQRLEADDFDNPFAQRWRTRIKNENSRIRSGVWVSRKSPKLSELNWIGPCYWNGTGAREEDIPKHLGPDAVLYGSLSGSQKKFQQGIGYGGSWLPILETS